MFRSYFTFGTILCRVPDQGTLSRKGPVRLTILQNSADGRLATDQLRLAYSSLVKGAASCSSPEDGSLVWFCIQLLVDKIGDLTSKSDDSEARSEELRRLRLTLLSTVPSISLPSPLLCKLLSAIDSLIRQERLKKEMAVLLAEMHEVMMLEVGDAD